MLKDKDGQQIQEYSEVLSEGMKPKEFIEELIQAGLIHRLVDEITIPIPSFRKFMIERSRHRKSAKKVPPESPNLKLAVDAVWKA